MILSVPLTPEVEAKLRERAAAAGLDPALYASELLEDIISRPSIDQILAPFRRQIADSGMTDQQLDEFYEELRDEVWYDRQGGKT